MRRDRPNPSGQIILRPRNPARTLVLLFFLFIAVGTLLLRLPYSGRNGTIDWSTAAFTATSAVCVTGLTVVDTPAAFSPFGQGVILLLVQAGGLGYMTSSTLLALLLRRQPGLHDRLLLSDTLGQLTLRDTGRVVWGAVRFTLGVEAAGALILAARFAQEPGRDLGEAVWLGVCNAVSAFCNADFVWLGSSGTGAHAGSLGRYRGDWVVNLTVMALVVIGGLGFVVCQELIRYRGKKPLSLLARLVLSWTGGLILFGAVVVLAAEWKNPGTLGPLPLHEKLLASLFHSITIRTAGFSTVDFGKLTSISLLLMGVLMFIGASPGGTGGGVKTTTFAVTVAAVWASLRGRSDVELFHRRVPPDTVYRALVLIFLSAAVIMTAIFILTLTEPVPLIAAGFRENLFVRIQFEVFSAFGTAGISTGITPSLTGAGRLVIMALMLLGRLGPLTVATALATPGPALKRRYAEEKVPLG
ncbi:MAG TPA: potassium transporter TrkG [Armatimonadota bacterium]|nr:potassium transporter TrkG [Armatimonadota bacterium]